MMLQSGLVFILMVFISLLLTIVMFIGALYGPLSGMFLDFVISRVKKQTAKENEQKR